MRGGYAHPAYARALEGVGHPRHLPRSGGWILERKIPATQAVDAMGCYPLFVCNDWSMLKNDLMTIGRELVSLVLVTDPFGDVNEELLRETFKDHVLAYKEHFVIDLGQTLEDFVHPHHQRNAREALRDLVIEQPDDPSQCLDEWTALYDNLIQRHEIRGIARFSKSSFAAQLGVPGINIFRARHRAQTVGMSLWYRDEAVVYYHLGAYSDAGYAQGASFAIFWRALQEFVRSRVRWIDLGSAAGARLPQEQDGLARFKKGWSNATRMTYVCGRIFKQGCYKELAARKCAVATNYFPAYRDGEFI